MAKHSGIRLIAGLGNPDEKYLPTRHNAGFWFVDAVAKKQGVGFRHQATYRGDVSCFPFAGEKIWLLKPRTFMNQSGVSLRSFAEFYRIPPQQILVVHDEIDLPNGAVKLKWAGGHGGHNGLRSVFTHVGADFLRLRLGVGHPGHKEDVTGYVLGKPGKQEYLAIHCAIDEAMEMLEDLFKGNTDAAMKKLHTGHQHGV
ncbi:MAG: aminoacyl-tRNA hydrolase [Gammaproteobacteria bacterium]|nr:aminoacyl-tRNA hydrolase [Gammaproteobacteria bacterium]